MTSKPVFPSALQLQPFHAMEVLARARALEAEGRKICHLEVGEPGVPPAPQVIEAVRQALPGAQRYTEAGGTRAVRERLAETYRARHRVGIDPARLLVTMGSSAGFILAFLSAFQPGATVAMTRPGYPGTLNTLLGLGFRVVEVGLSATNGWRLTGAEIKAAHRREPFVGLVFASPANPTGAAVDREGLRNIVETCRRLGVRLISDEIYGGLDFRGPSPSAAEFGNDSIIVNSFSKYHCMTGWRAGWLVLPEDLRAKALMLAQNLFISAPTLSQVAALAALDADDYAEGQKESYRTNGALLSKGLKALGFAEVREPDGAFYAYVNCGELAGRANSLEFAFELLEQAGVAVAPGIDFDRTDGGRYLRFSFAADQQTIEEGLERLARFLASR